MQRTCSEEIFNVKTRKSNVAGKSEYIDRLTIEFILTRAGIFKSHEAVEMNNDYFWKVIRKRDDSGTVLDRTKEYLPFTKAEERIRDRIKNIDRVSDDQFDEGDNDDDDNESTTSSVAVVDVERTSEAVEDVSSIADEAGWELLSDELKAKEARESLKKLGNISRRKLHKHALKDVFIHGDIMLKKNIMKIRTKALRRKKRKYQLIMMAMKHFDTQMTYRRKVLDA